MAHNNAGWSGIDYKEVVRLLKEASNGYDVPAVIKRYGCFESEPTSENPRDIIIYLEGLIRDESEDRSFQYQHSISSENVLKAVQGADAHEVYKNIIADRRRFDQEQIAVSPANQRHIIGTDTHNIRIIKNRMAEGILDEWSELDPTIGEKGRIEITYRLPRYGVVHGGCANDVCAVD